MAVIRFCLPVLKPILELLGLSGLMLGQLALPNKSFVLGDEYGRRH